MSFQLSTRELEIHERAYKELKNLISDKTKSVLMKSAKYDADPVVSKYHEFSKRYQGYIRELYEEVQESGLKNTHEKITELAFNISCADISEKKSLILSKPAQALTAHLLQCFYLWKGIFMVNQNPAVSVISCQNISVKM